MRYMSKKKLPEKIHSCVKASLENQPSTLGSICRGIREVTVDSYRIDPVRTDLVHATGTIPAFVIVSAVSCLIFLIKQSKII